MRVSRFWGWGMRRFRVWGVRHQCRSNAMLSKRPRLPRLFQHFATSADPHTTRRIAVLFCEKEDCLAAVAEGFHT